MCVLALREANKHAPNRTVTRVIWTRTERCPGLPLRNMSDRVSILIADEHRAYDDLVGLVALHRVNHSHRYQEEDGKLQRHRELLQPRREGLPRHQPSLLDEVPRLVRGYARWKEDTRYMGLRWQFADLLRTVTSRPTSRNLWRLLAGAAGNIQDQVWLRGIPPD